MTPDLFALSLFEDYRGNSKLIIGNGEGLSISNVGYTYITIASKTLKFRNVLHVPSITKPLLSVKIFYKDNKCFFEFHDYHCLVKDQVTRRMVL